MLARREKVRLEGVRCPNGSDKFGEQAMPLKSFEVENYRAFVEPAKVELKELTLLFGYNNAGKSALARVLPLLRDSCFERRGLPLNLESAAVRGGEFEDLRSRQTGTRKIILVLEWDVPEIPSGMEEVHEDIPDIQMGADLLRR